MERQEAEVADLQKQEDEAMALVMEDQRKESQELRGLAKERAALREHVTSLKETLKQRERDLKLSYAAHARGH